MSRPTIAVADPIHAAGLERLRAGYEVAFLPEIAAPESRANALAAAEAVVVRVFKIDEALLQGAPRLKLVAKHGSGVDNIDIPAASRHGVLVCNTPGGANSSSVAEGAVTLMLATLRQVRAMDACVREGRFNERWKLSLRELWGKTVGLVGFGQIARVAARICGAGFNARVLAFDPFVSAADMEKAGATKVETLAELARQADIVSVHVPLSKQTEHLINAEVLAAMQRHAIIVNTSRGGLIDEAALVRALQAGQIAGAGLDVFEQEPPAADNPLFAMNNVVLSPHVAGVTEDALRGMAMSVAEVIDNVFAGRRPPTLLNADLWERRKS
jgi:D-3-phosphoglycerate dehydrogenase